jgi:hypothetical protein
MADLPSEGGPEKSGPLFIFCGFSLTRVRTCRQQQANALKRERS